MAPNEIYLANFPFGGSVGMKLRPVLLLTGPIGPVPEFSTAYITSVNPAVILPSDLVLDPRLPEYASSGMKLTSILRLHKLATLHERTFVRRLGKLSQVAAAEVSQRLRVLLKI